MTFRFRASPSPDDALLDVLCRADPVNPFLTRDFMSYRCTAGQGIVPWLLGLEQASELQTGCIAYLQPSRLPWSNRLEIHSLADLPEAGSRVFWEGLWSLCRQHRVSRLTLQTFGSRPPTHMPDRPGRLWHRNRLEYLLQLDGDAGRKALSSNHRRNVNRAERAGIVFVESSDPAAVGVHASLMGLSMQRRRGRGEAVGDGDATDPTQRLIASGAARIYQAVLGVEVLSSILVLRARSGAYYHSAGTSPEGMKAGASHLLVQRLVEHLRDEGLRVFNLGGADSDGLARFKTGFGAEAVELEVAAYFTGNRISKLFDIFSAGLRRLRS